MKTLNHTLFALTIATATLGAAHAADFGQTVDQRFSQRTVNLDAGTRYVNVTDGETVDFVQNGKHFTFHFDTYPNVTEVDLKNIAPAGFDAGAVEVYVASNPLYRG
ncbi:hypothetical protein FHW58_003985 [Duganella sp. 1224]|uniref:CzcE family metal-binding protein n=1 Tax=Duganella sp. 1224 TaxID=2587052 RepID=UPI0015CADB7C|nr:CzcE family metal-binding protein [Duganella sp. 1224]NYE62766.1 hypothetical protein [Duganella sp. 1224]